MWLAADPSKRITISQIYRHPWYTKNLPPGVVEMNNRPQPAPEGMQVSHLKTLCHLQPHAITTLCGKGEEGAVWHCSPGSCMQLQYSVWSEQGV